MTEKYDKQIVMLADWFTERLGTYPPLTIAGRDYDKGTDCLTGDYKRLVAEGVKNHIDRHKYLLSYNQVCNAFFRAAFEAGKLTVDRTA